MRRRRLVAHLPVLAALPSLAPRATHAQALPPRAVRAPAILAKSAFLLDAVTGASAFQKFPDTRRALASTTKLMTGLLAVESGRLDEVTTVSRIAATVGETTMGLYEGERITLRALLYGLMMNSGNDAAISIAEHLAGSVAAFAGQMNARAEALGLTNTRFVNPHGLDHAQYFSPNHYSSARDLARLAATALADPTLAEAAGSLYGEIPAGVGRAPHRVRHSLSALWWYPGTVGGKTGFTGRAGQVRVTVAERAGTRLVAVVMDSPDHVAETRDLLDFGFASATRPEVRATVPVGADVLPTPDAKLTRAWQSFTRLALTDDGRVRRGAASLEGSADAQAAALLHAVWMRDRRVFDSLWSWTQLALWRTAAHPANPKRTALFASRWDQGDVTDWNNSAAADQRIAAALLLASRLWNDPSYYDASVKVLDAVLEDAAISWDVRGVPATGWSVTAANSFLKELEPVTTSAASITPAFYRMFAEAGRSSVWLWLLDGAYRSLETAASPRGPLGNGAGLLPGWFSVSRATGAVGAPVDPTWQSTGFTLESAGLVWQLALDVRWNADERAMRLLAPTAQLAARDLAQRGRLAPTYTRSGQPGSGLADAAGTETGLYGALSGVTVADRSTEPSFQAKIDAALASSDPDRVLDAMDGLWMLAGGPPNFWRLWNPPRDVPTSRNDGVIPPTDNYPWRYFPETGHTVYGDLLQFFVDGGGVEVFGLPRTDELIENGRSVQYFDKSLLEYAASGPVQATAIVADEVLRARGWLA